MTIILISLFELLLLLLQLLVSYLNLFLCEFQETANLGPQPKAAHVLPQSPQSNLSWILLGGNNEPFAEYALS